MSASNKKDFINKTKIEFYKEIKKYQQNLMPTKEIEGFGGSAIVGEKNYPNLKVHNISNSNFESSFFNTNEIVKKDYNDILKLKARNILGSTEEAHKRKVDSRINTELQDVYKSKKAVEFNSEFEKELQFDKVLVNKVSGIVGSRNPLLTLEATENTSTSKNIEKFTTGDVKSREAIISLYEKGTNENQIINLLALGTLGIQSNKRLVPTKWSISAYDQTIEKYLHKKLLKYRVLNEFEVYEYHDKGNYFVEILIPDSFQGEVVEAFTGFVERDYVGLDNKLNKPEPETSGGFYATKIAIFEHLEERKRQAAFVSLRLISGYDIPLGVVFVRECVREALKKKPLFRGTSEKELNEFLSQKYPKHFKLYSESRVLKERKRQRKLGEYL